MSAGDTPAAFGEHVWDLELFGSLDTLNLLEDRFMSHLYSPEQVESLRSNLELAAW